MQIVPITTPQAPASALPPQTITNVLPEVAAQAVAPISASAVRPSGESAEKQKTRSRADRDKNAREEDSPSTGPRGHQVNIRV